MSHRKGEEEARENAWLNKAESEGWQCKRCGATPPDGEQEVFFRTGYCGACAHTAEKDD